MGKYIVHLLKKYQSKLSTPTPKKPVLSSSAAHASSTSNSTGTIILSQLDNKDITTNQNMNNTSNTYGIHSGVTQLKENYSVHATYTTTLLNPLNATPPIVPVDLHTTKNYPLPVKNIYVFRLMVDLLILTSV